MVCDWAKMYLMVSNFILGLNFENFIKRIARAENFLFFENQRLLTIGCLS